MMKSSSQQTPLLLPTVFGKCLTLEIEDPNSLSVKPLEKQGHKEKKEAHIIAYIEKNLPQTGVLTMDSRKGYIYLDIPNTYIYDLYPLLERSDATIPPYFDASGLPGAHISVALASEERKNLVLNELDDEIPFTVTGCYVAKPENWYDIDSLWFLTVDAPELSRIRNRLGLSDKIYGREFHITFALKKRFLALEDVMSEGEKENIVVGSEKVTAALIDRLKNGST